MAPPSLILLVDLHRHGLRQGPGSEAATLLAIDLSGLRGRPDLRIADIGCGTGASTLVLARELSGSVAAVDVLPEFLGDLEARAERAGLADRVETVQASMEELPFEDGELDAIWSEGAIYNLGFERGIRAWRRYLKPGGMLAVSELTWLTAERPEELDEHWNREYPEVATAAEKLALLERAGYSPVGYFALPRECWMEHYYTPLRERFEAFLQRRGGSDEARELVEAEEAEIALYERNAAFVSYGFYIAMRV